MRRCQGTGLQEPSFFPAGLFMGFPSENPITTVDNDMGFPDGNINKHHFTEWPHLACLVYDKTFMLLP